MNKIFTSKLLDAIHNFVWEVGRKHGSDESTTVILMWFYVVREWMMNKKKTLFFLYKNILKRDKIFRVLHRHPHRWNFTCTSISFLWNITILGKVVRRNEWAKGGFLNVLCHLEDGEIIIVEIQWSSEDYYQKMGCVLRKSCLLQSNNKRIQVLFIKNSYHGFICGLQSFLCCRNIKLLF